MNLPTADQVHLWKIDHSTVTTPAPYALLDRQEQDRAQRFKFETHRHAFALNRAAMKLILARYCGIAPEDIMFSYNQFGKPLLPDQPELQFNLSHSADKALLAVSHKQPVGVDCEAIKHIDSMDAIALSQFSGAEYAHLMSLPSCQIAGAFYQYWTRRESLMKAVGMGFSLNIRELCFDQEDAFTGNGCAMTLGQLPDSVVIIKDCESFAGFRASVARQRSLGEVTCFAFHAR